MNNRIFRNKLKKLAAESSQPISLEIKNNTNETTVLRKDPPDVKVGAREPEIFTPAAYDPTKTYAGDFAPNDMEKF